MTSWGKLIKKGMRKLKKRMFKTALCLTLVFALSAAAVARIALSDAYKASAGVYSGYSVAVDRPRGTVFDRNLDPITNREEKYKAVLTATPEVTKELYRCFSAGEAEKIVESLRENKPLALYVPKDFSASGAAVFKIYDKTPAYIPAVQLIGYLDFEELHGKAGLEAIFDSRLICEKESTAAVSANAAGSPLLGVNPEKNDLFEEYEKGIITTLDLRIQQAAEQALSGVKKGAVAVTKTSSGEILALCSTPSFSPKNLSAALDNADSPFLNRGLLSYNLGSIFKICVAAAALENGISPEEKYFCSGSVDCGNVFCCHKEDGHEEIDMSEAFAKSCNTYFINLAEKVGAESIFDFAQKAGLSADVVITEGLTAKSSLGQLSKIKESPAALANFAIGQGDIAVSPLQVSLLVNAVANGGVYFPPFLVSGFKDKDGKTEYQKGTEGRRIMSKETAVTLSNMMTRVFEDGTAAASRPKSGLYGGKTATAETGWKTADGSAGKNAWFAGFYEFGGEKLSVAVLAEGGESGAADAVPVFKSLCDALSDASAD